MSSTPNCVCAVAPIKDRFTFIENKVHTLESIIDTLFVKNEKVTVVLETIDGWIKAGKDVYINVNNNPSEDVLRKRFVDKLSSLLEVIREGKEERLDEVEPNTDE